MLRSWSVGEEWLASEGARRNMCSCSLRESQIREVHLRHTRWIANNVVASRYRKVSSSSSVVARTWSCADDSGVGMIEWKRCVEASLGLPSKSHIRPPSRWSWFRLTLSGQLWEGKGMLVIALSRLSLPVLLPHFEYLTMTAHISERMLC